MNYSVPNLEPEDMSEVTIVGPKDRLEAVLDTLQEEKVIQFKNNDTNWQAGEPLQEAEETSRLLLQAENLLSKMENISNRQKKAKPTNNLESQLIKLKEEYETLETRKTTLEESLDEIDSKIKFLEDFESRELVAKDLRDTENVKIRYTDNRIPQDIVNLKETEVVKGKEGVLLYFKESAKEVIDKKNIDLETVPEFKEEGSIEEILNKLTERREKLTNEYDDVVEQIQNFERREGPVIQAIKEELELRLERAEAPLKFGFRDKTFVAKGYIPANEVDHAKNRLEEVTDEAIAVEVDEAEDPPTKLEHNDRTKPFEALTNLVGTPKHNEVDPTTLIFMLFPIFFGFMVGDIVHGLAMAAIFYAGMRMMPDLKDIYTTLMWCSGFTVLFGFLYGQALGFQIFGPESVLAGYLPVAQEIPVIYDREAAWDQVLYVSAIIGFAHVNLGILLGAYNRYIQDSLTKAILDKGSWLVLQGGALLAYFSSTVLGSLVSALGLIMLAKGPGIQGLIMIPNLLGFILSYLRLFGVALGGAVIATLINGTAAGLVATGTIWGIAAAATIFVFGHVFLTGLKILQGGLQGIRLHYVEFFNYFFEGSGKKFIPFGKKYSR